MISQEFKQTYTVNREARHGKVCGNVGAVTKPSTIVFPALPADLSDVAPRRIKIRQNGVKSVYFYFYLIFL